MSTHRVEELKSDSNLFSTEIQSVVRSELELILSSLAFSQSNRCKRFLNFVVTQTLSGRGGELKERTIGISLFDRAIDYDTGGDSIVRVTSNEVRKRIGQFYRESATDHEVQIELPRGSYVPEFRIRSTKRGKDANSSKSTDLSSQESGTNEQEPGQDAQARRVPSEVNVPSKSANETVEKARSLQGRKIWTSAAVVIAVLFTALAVWTWRSETQKTYPSLWASLEHTRVPVLICLGAHDIPFPTNNSPSETEDSLMRKDTIPVDDVTAITTMASLLGKQGIPFRVASANQTSLTDFRRQPVVLIGAVDNKWTIRLTQDLRYRVEVVLPAKNGSPAELVTEPPRGDRVPVASIIDSKDPSAAPWTVDFTIPLQAWKSDYAIVASVNDPTTGVPVIVDAGLGNDGSLAASELITSGELSTQLAKEASCQNKSNFEAVVETNMIDTRPGPPHVLRLSCW